MFNTNEKVVYPGHGVAKINRIISKKVAGRTVDFFELKFIHKEMTILVPIENVACVGIRSLSSVHHVGDIFKILSQPIIPINHESAVANWNKRNKDYLGKIRSGDLREISTIYRDLRHIEIHKELSFGEKDLLHKTEALLAEEIALVENIGEENAITKIRSSISVVTER